MNLMGRCVRHLEYNSMYFASTSSTAGARLVRGRPCSQAGVSEHALSACAPRVTGTFDPTASNDLTRVAQSSREVPGRYNSRQDNHDLDLLEGAIRAIGVLGQTRFWPRVPPRRGFWPTSEDTVHELCKNATFHTIRDTLEREADSPIFLEMLVVRSNG